MDLLGVKRPALAYYERDELGNDPSNWSGPNPAAVLAMLRTVGFKRVEIVADQGIAARVAPAEWQAACSLMQEAFRAGRFEAGAVAGVEAVSALLAKHFPPAAGNANELPDQPVML